MGKILRKTASVLMVVVMCLTMVPLQGFVGLDASNWFAIKAKAAKTPTVYSQLSDTVAYNYPGGKGSTYKTSGCGVYAIVNSIKYLTDKKIDPHELGKLAINCGARVNGGTRAGVLAKKCATSKDFGEKYGFYVSEVYSFGKEKNKMICKIGNTRSSTGYPTASQWEIVYNKLIDHLSKGEVAVVLVMGHYMSIVEYDSSTDKFLMLDSAPYTSKRLSANRGRYQWVTADQLNYNKAPKADSSYTNQKPYIHLRSELIFFAKTEVDSYTLDINYTLNGKVYKDSNDIFTCDVYIDDKLVADDVSDYFKSLKQGTKYKINDIKVAEGFDYQGVIKGSLEGTLSNEPKEVQLGFSTLSTPTLVASTYFGNSKYELYSGNVSWSYADYFARSLGGHLATITTGNEQQKVKSIAGSLSNVWLGGSMGDDAWKWQNGEEFSYNNWNTSTSDAKNYLAMITSTGKWDKYDLYSAKIDGFIVEKNIGNSYLNFNVNHDSIPTNMFRSPCEDITVNGITYKYDKYTQVLTLNGTASQQVTQIGILPFWAYVGDTYTASCHYISGSVIGGGLCYDVCGDDTYRLTSRKYLSCKNGNSSSTWNFTEKDSTNVTRENSAASYVKLWIDNTLNDNQDVVFNNYKIKIKLEKGGTATEYTPARMVATEGEGLGRLPTVYRRGYTFDGWYTDPTDGYLIEDYSECCTNEVQNLYAHWEPNKVTTTFDVSHSNINPNMFSSPSEINASNEIDYSYDSNTGILTINGTSADTVTQIGKVPFWVNVGDVYTASGYYISGSVTNGELCYEVCGADGYRLSDRRYLSSKNSDSSVTWTFTDKDSTDTERENAAGSFLKLWIYNSGDDTVIFDNYKICIKLEKGSKSTDYSPARIVSRVGDIYGALPTVYRKGYSFAGWYTSSTDGSQITSNTKLEEVDYQTLYAHWEGNKVVSTFDVAHSGINPNMFESPCESISTNGIDYSYDSETGILTLNGTASEAVTQIGKTAFWVNIGDVYTVSSYYVSGSVRNGELCYDVCGADGNRVSDRRYLALGNSDSSVTWNFTTKDSTDTERENAAGSYLKLWIDNSNDGKDVVFDNYKIRIKLEKGNKVTDYSPARLVIRVGDTYGKLPVPTREGYSFDGWYTNVENGSEVTETTVCTEDTYKTLYAKWICKHGTTEVRNAKSASCSTEGYTGDTHCKLCGVKTKTGTSIAKLSHSYTSVVTKATTCTSDGVRTYTCSKCTDSYTESIPATGHSWTTATCTAPKTCSTCGTTSGSALGHNYTAKVTKDATCTTDGVKTYTCSKCTDSYTESIPATGHSWTTATCTAPKTCSTCGTTSGSALGHNYTAKVTKDATCTTDGVKTYTCSKCTDSYTESIPATGHSWTTATCTAPKICSTCKVTEGSALGHSYTSKITEPTCTEDGYTTYECSVCGNGYSSDFVKSKGHFYADGLETKAPTCTTSGTKTYTCSNCSNSYTETIPAIGHSWTAATCTAPKACSKCGTTEGSALGHSYSSKITNVATCTTNGTKTYTCSRCSDSYAETITATGHNWMAATCTSKKTCLTCGTTDGSVLGHSYAVKTTKEPTCTTSGTKVHACSRCSDSYTETIPSTDHSYISTVVAPTCTEEGYTLKKCRNCDYSQKVDYTEAVGHNMGQWKITREETCTEDGEKSRRCLNCDYAQTQIIYASGHSMGSWKTTKQVTCTENGEKKNSCLNCDYYTTQTVYASGHSMSAWKTVKKATCTENGTKQSSCSECDYTEIKTINANGHSYVSEVTKDATCTTTGVETFSCSVCEDSYTKTIEKLGHKYSSSYTVDKKATCSAEGSKSKHCTRSGCTAKTSVTAIAKLAHTYDNNCDKTCNVCKATRSISHSYKNVTTNATLTKNGKVESKCSVCGYVSKTTTIYYPKTIKLSATSYTYNGKVKSPTVTVKDSKGNALKKDTDYTVSYASGRKNTGKYSVTVTFKGKYSGKKVLYFNILPSKTSKITPTCGTTSIKASWSKVTGASGYKVELLNSKGKVVKSATTTKTAYTFKSLSKVTTYKVRVTAYKTIDKKAVYSTVSTTITTSTSPTTVTLSKVTAGSKSATPAWKKVSGASGYEVMYSTSSKFSSSKTATIKNGSSTKTTIKKLTKGKKYYFKVRAYKTVDGKKVYGAWSAVKSVKVK